MSLAPLAQDLRLSISFIQHAAGLVKAAQDRIHARFGRQLPLEGAQFRLAPDNSYNSRIC